MISDDDKNKLKEIADIMSKSKNILFVTGAGMSAESGLPTYRGIGGLYNEKDPDENLPIEALMSGSMFESRPELTWKYLNQIASVCKDASFNKGHRILAEWEDLFTVMVYTQNVDGFHKRAGSRNVVEIHGNFGSLYCPVKSCTYIENRENYDGLEIPPHCPKCGAVIRPDVVLFGEILSREKIEQLAEFVDERMDLVFSIGTTSVFQYVSYPIINAAKRGIPSVEINPGLTEVSLTVDYKIRSGAGEALEMLNNFLKLSV